MDRFVSRRVRVTSVTIAIAAAITIVGCSSSDESTAATTAKPPSTTVATPTTAAPTTAAPSTTVATGARASAGCGKAPAVTGPAHARPFDVPLTFDSGGTTRAYRLGIPDTYDPQKPAPLVLALHGSGSNAVQQSVYADIPREAGRRGYITVTPDAVDGVWQRTADGTDDAYLDELVTSVENDYCVDLDRVHTAGISLGAWKASIVACRHADRYASVALVAEDVHPPRCPPMAVIAFHGTADHTVPYGEGADAGVTVTGANAGLPGARNNLAQWAAGAGCSDDKTVTEIGADIELWRYRGCPDNLAVDFYTVKGGDHSWPGADIIIKPTTKTIGATELALDFFDAHPMR